MRIFSSIIPLLLFPFFVAAQQISADQGTYPDIDAAVNPPPSWIEIPISFSLSALRGNLERSVPRVQGNADHWKQYRGVDVKYRIWRGPLDFRMYGDYLHTYVPIGYWVQARKVFLKKLKIKGSCGVDEPPRYALVHLVSRFRWNPHWHLDAFTQVLPIQYANPCQMSIAKIDVTPLIDRYLYNRLIKATREQIDAAISKLTHMEVVARQAWSALQQPIPVAENSWLLVRPQAVSLAPFRGEGDRVYSGMGIRVQPKIVYGAKPDAKPTELPSLNLDRTIRPGFSVVIDLELEFTQAAARLAEALTGLLRMGDTDLVKITDLRITGDADRIWVAIAVDGAFEGAFKVSGKPVLDEKLNAIALEELEYQPQIDLLPLRLVSKQLEHAANWPLAEHLETAKRRLNAALNRNLGTNLKLHTEIESVTPVALQSDEDKLIITVRVTGSTKLVLN